VDDPINEILEHIDEEDEQKPDDSKEVKGDETHEEQSLDSEDVAA
jgi:hypothetical protein